ncbi:lipoprotein [Williamsoniiplasma lucivorax]|uniref:Lipoprotein n=1 Tax=Williamsoniiplasma lucivorax TaxID=209274 RepID=A0A2S5RDT1_9MOLU|nr:lipoprotein [Williamsoniiplasma lucivorax]PPE05473.1 hypothetical protein ELUCI_v1c05660 [Williamsoniiplasma lucivorax]
MRKLLSFIGTVGIAVSATLTVVACSGGNPEDKIVTLIEKTKNSAGVIYLGAKDNASSRSFEYGFKKAMDVDSMDEVSRKLSAEFTPGHLASPSNWYVDSWQTVFNQTWKDTDLPEANVNLDTNSKKYGQITGAKDHNLFTKPTGPTNFFFDYISYDKVEDLSKATSDLADKFIRKDLMIQLASVQQFYDNPNGKDLVTKRKTAIDNAINDIKTNITKGPVFLVVKNGHIVSINNGWFRYGDEFLKNGSTKELPSGFERWYHQFIYAIQPIMYNSLSENNFKSLFNKEAPSGLVKSIIAKLDSWDQGASNWDTKNDHAKDSGVSQTPTPPPTEPEEPKDPKPTPPGGGEGTTQKAEKNPKSQSNNNADLKKRK